MGQTHSLSSHKKAFPPQTPGVFQQIFSLPIFALSSERIEREYRPTLLHYSIYIAETRQNLNETTAICRSRMWNIMSLLGTRSNIMEKRYNVYASYDQSSIIYSKNLCSRILVKTYTIEQQLNKITQLPKKGV